MGIHTPLSLKQAQTLFPSYHIISIEATIRGVSDTTYKAYSQESCFIRKKYETAHQEQIDQEQALLQHLKQHQLNVPQALAHSEDWYLFSMLDGEIPHKITLTQLRSIAHFLAHFHKNVTHRKSSLTPFTASKYQKSIKELRKKHLLLSKQLSLLTHFPKQIDGIIHGDLFCDNSKFDGAHLAVFDFIEAGNGSFAFDLGVVAMSWIAKKRLSQLQLKLLLKSYNQHSKQKIPLIKLIEMMHFAALVYALKRFNNPLSSLDHKEMLGIDKKIHSFEKLYFYHKKSQKE